MVGRQAEIHPMLDLSGHPARLEATYAHEDRGVLVLGNGFLEVRLYLREPGHQRATLLNKITGDSFDLVFMPFEMWFNVGAISGSEMTRGKLECRGSPHASAIRWWMSLEWFDVELSYVLYRGDHFFRKSMVIHGLQRKLHLSRVSLFKHQVSAKYEILQHDAGLYYPVVFLRDTGSSVFLSGDYAGYFVARDDHSVTFDYYPGADLEPGRSFQTLTSHIGICALTGRTRHNPYHETGADLDMGERAWFREFVLRSNTPKSLPYIELKGPEPGRDGPSDHEILAQCGALGARHVLLPRLLTHVESYPELDHVKGKFREHQIAPSFLWPPVRPVDKMPAGGPAGPAPADGTISGLLTLGNTQESAFEEYLAVMQRHGFKDCEVRGVPILPYGGAARANRAEDVEYLHKAFQGLVDEVAMLKENFGDLSSSGVFASYGAGLAQLFDATGLLAEDHPLPLPDIHPGRLFGDMTRLYFRRSHDFLMPKARLTNGVGLSQEACDDAPYAGARHYPWYRYHDSAGWRYAVLSAIATGLRHRFHPMPTPLPEADLRFVQKWLTWEREHINELREVEEILDEPGLNQVDGYSYTNARGSIVFLFNASYDPQPITLHLRLQHDWEYIVRELYPREYNCLGPEEGLFRKDSTLELVLEPKSARVIEAVRRSPAAAKRKRPELFGVESCTEDGQLYVAGAPGTAVRAGVRVDGRYVEKRIEFPGTCPERTITRWIYAVDSLDDGGQHRPHAMTEGTPYTTEMKETQNVWLASEFTLPAELAAELDTGPFELNQPCWTTPGRLFAVVRFEPPAVFDPIRTSSDRAGYPENSADRLSVKCGIDLAPLNLGLRAWVNGEECVVYPAHAAWRRFYPNPHPVVAFFFETGSKIRFGEQNRLVLFARHFVGAIFRGIVFEHLPELRVKVPLEL